MTPQEARRAMAAAIGEKLAMWRERDECLSETSLKQLRCFAYDKDVFHIRLVVRMKPDECSLFRAVNIALVKQDEGGYRFNVKVSASCFSSTPEQTEQAVKGWGLVHGLALAALRLADSLPPITDEVAA